MSISELIFELRDSFLQRDFDRIEETLVARETKLKAEIEDQKREIVMLNNEVHCQKLEKLSVEMELKRLKELRDAVPGDILAIEAALKSAIEEKFGEIEKNGPFRGKLTFKIKVQAIRGEKRGKEFIVGEQGKKDGPEASGNWGQNSSREVPINYTTEVTELAGVIKRDFTSSVDVAKYSNELENASPSSSSSSSSSADLDISYTYYKLM